MSTEKNSTRSGTSPQGKSVHRSLPDNEPWFAVARSTAQHGARDGGLSFEARGVLLYLLSKPGDWQISVDDIQREGNIGRDKTKRLLKELREHGYILTEMTHGEDGKFAGKREVVYSVAHRSTETPLDGLSDRSTEKPLDGETVVRKTHDIQYIDSIQNTESNTTVPDGTGADANAPRTDTPPASNADPKPDSVPDKPKPKRARSGRKPPKPRSEYEQRDDLYEAVEREVFGFVGQDTEPYHYTAPTGGITSWLRGRIAQYNKTPLVGSPDFEQHPEDVAAFVKWWKRTRKGADVPQKVDAFARHYRAFLNERPYRPSPASHIPLVEHDDLLDALVEDVG